MILPSLLMQYIDLVYTNIQIKHTFKNMETKCVVALDIEWNLAI
jgi:hypothetical protein